jgi:hypothetical protein
VEDCGGNQVAPDGLLFALRSELGTSWTGVDWRKVLDDVVSASTQAEVLIRHEAVEPVSALE